MSTAHGLGWVPSLPDHRDFLYAAPREVLGDLPPSVSLKDTGFLEQPYDQLQVGSCVANAGAKKLVFLQHKEGLPVIEPSRLAMYWDARALEGSTASDAGCQPRDLISSLAQSGYCSEDLWPYNPQNALIQPPQACVDAAVTHKALTYQAVPQTLPQLRGCLADGYPFLFGFSVYEFFESSQMAETGVLQLPGPDESMVGGHGVLCVGYDDAAQAFLVMNSWGASWGQAGYFTMPYAYMLSADLVDDIWTIRLVS